MKYYRLSRSEAVRLGRPDLALRVVQLEMMSPAEIATPSIRHTPYAKGVYFGGEKVGQHIAIDPSRLVD